MDRICHSCMEFTCGFVRHLNLRQPHHMSSGAPSILPPKVPRSPERTESHFSICLLMDTSKVLGFLEVRRGQGMSYSLYLKKISKPKRAMTNSAIVALNNPSTGIPSIAILTTRPTPTDRKAIIANRFEVKVKRVMKIPEIRVRPIARYKAPEARTSFRILTLPPRSTP